MDLKDRKSKVDISMFGKISKDVAWSLPNILMAKDIKEVAKKINEHSYKRRYTAYTGEFILLMEGHPIKVGISPFIIDMIQKKLFTHVAMNGAAMYHDIEIALEGKTSEYVEETIGTDFAERNEATELIIKALSDNNIAKVMTLGQLIGATIDCEHLQYANHSILCNCINNEISTTVHQMLGTDVYHQHLSSESLEELQKISIIDYRTLDVVISILLSTGGVLINLGSAVMFPEIFLKCLSRHHIDKNQSKNITLVNMDFQPSYRELNNIVNRPKLLGIETYNLIGCHEIMFPLLHYMIMNGVYE